MNTWTYDTWIYRQIEILLHGNIDTWTYDTWTYDTWIYRHMDILLHGYIDTWTYYYMDI